MKKYLLARYFLFVLVFFAVIFIIFYDGYVLLSQMRNRKWLIIGSKHREEQQKGSEQRCEGGVVEINKGKR